MTQKEAAMSIQLNEEQGKALDSDGETPPRVVDPRTNRTYVLIPAEQYDRLRALLEEELDIRSAYPLMDAVASKEGWDDPSMDIYNDFLPREKP
jgi:hypothetical protein